MNKSLLLCILDGWGYSKKHSGNAIYHANTPFIDYLYKNHPVSFIKTSGENVGLPKNQIGNSEVGHMTISAGRVLKHDITLMSDLVNDEIALSKNKAVQNIINKTTNICHVIGLLSDGGIHSHIDHIIKMIKHLESSGVKVCLHVFTDGRDVDVKSALKYIQMMLEIGVNISTISGRYYAMDRDNRWERVKLAYEAITFGNGNIYDDPLDYIKASYDVGVYDEFIIPGVQKSYKGIMEGDTLMILNFRADRVVQLLSLIAKHKSKLASIAGIKRYSNDLPIDGIILFKSRVVNHLGEVLSNEGLNQLRIAETEKYAHVTYFFNCGVEKKFRDEDRILIKSPNVKFYNEIPEMSAYSITDRLLQTLREKKYNFVCLNYANADMVGHTGDMKASIRACEVIDDCLSKVAEFCKKKDMEILITADHGNVEELGGNGLPIKTSHTLNDVPLFYLGKEDAMLRNGMLCDIAPTVLDILGIKAPKEMTGKSLFVRSSLLNKTDI